MINTNTEKAIINILPDIVAGVAAILPLKKLFVIIIIDNIIEEL